MVHFTSVSTALTSLEEVLFYSTEGEEAVCFRRMTEVCANNSSWGSTKPWLSQSFLPAPAEWADSEAQASCRLSLFKQWCHNFLIPLLSSCICSTNDSPSLLDLGHFSLLTSAFVVPPRTALPVTFASLGRFAFVLFPSPFNFFFLKAPHVIWQFPGRTPF